MNHPAMRILPFQETPISTVVPQTLLSPVPGIFQAAWGWASPTSPALAFSKAPEMVEAEGLQDDVTSAEHAQINLTSCHVWHDSNIYIYI